MDEISCIEVNEGCPWEKEILDSGTFYRRVHYKQRAKKSRIPNESAFTLRQNETSMSFNWNRYIDHIHTFLQLGLCINLKTDDFMKVKDFKLVQIPVEVLKKLPNVIRLEHLPDYHGNPSPIGKPNNKSHSGLFLGEDDDTEFRVLAAKYCQENEAQCVCDLNFEDLEQRLVSLRKQGNNTPYHTDWNLEKIQ